jgi:hypothetical protein|tara:strand:- start:1462 stop:2364 length:903 start_codon:yes stop_codon:yes gene_type:complete
MNFTSKFLDSFSDNSFFDFDQKYKLKKKSQTILPLGNCFLDIFAKELKKSKYKICDNEKPNKIAENGYKFFFGNYYNPLNLLHTLQRITKRSSIENSSFTFSKPFGHYICLYTKARYQTKNLTDLKKRIKEIDKYLLNEIKKSTLILLSFETNEAWIDKKTNKAWYTFYGDLYSQNPLEKRAKLEVIDANRLKSIMKSIINILNKIGKKKKFILMTSPNHLWTTYQNLDVKLADSYSKYVFSSAFHELENGKNIKYFPAYEIFSRFNSKKIKKYRDDQLHVGTEFTNKVLLKYFKKYFFK